jgi:hypothetical protein
MFQFINRKTNHRNTKGGTLADHIRKQDVEEGKWAQERGRNRRM